MRKCIYISSNKSKYIKITTSLSKNQRKLIPALSLPAVSKIRPSSDTAIEVTAESCFLNVATHFLCTRSQTRTVASSLPEKSYKHQSERSVENATKNAIEKNK